MCHNVQKYDKRHFLRAEEAHRCRVHSALFMPLYTSADRRQPFAVFEVVQADADVLFPVLVQWLKSCLQVSGSCSIHSTSADACVALMVPVSCPASPAELAELT